MSSRMISVFIGLCRFDEDDDAGCEGPDGEVTATKSRYRLRTAASVCSRPEPICTLALLLLVRSAAKNCVFFAVVFDYCFLSLSL